MQIQRQDDSYKVSLCYYTYINILLFLRSNENELERVTT